jgi:N-sulfoglucosamine sulfohydrolase
MTVATTRSYLLAMGKRRVTLITVLCMAIPLFASSAIARPNILLIVSEDNGPELGCYGDPYARTPNLDRLAADGVRFERAFVPYSVCSPSRAVFLTGLYAHQNGQIGLATHKFALYDPKTPNAFTLLKAAGYRTGLIGKLHVNPESAFPVDFRKITGANFGRRKMEEYSNAAAEFFNASDEPFFLSINYPDAHLPFHRQQFGRPQAPLTGADVKPLPWVGVDSPRLREVTADYYNCMARLDDGVGLLLKELEASGKADDTLIVYIGDHGAQFPRGKVSVYEGGLKIPFIIKWPRDFELESDAILDQLVSTVDILPTFLEAADQEIPSRLPGLPLQRLCDASGSEWRQYIYGFTTGSYPHAFQLRWSIRDDRYKLLLSLLPGEENLGSYMYLEPTFRIKLPSRFTAEEQASALPSVAAALARFRTPPQFELFDLLSDPHEWNNLADDPDMATVKQRLINALARFRTQTRDPFLDAKNVADFRRSQFGAHDMKYRKAKIFRWPYLDDFAEWRRERE